MNSEPWAGGGVFTWIVTAVNYIPWDLSASPIEWLFNFEFQNDVAGWRPEIIYTDSRTGNPPDGIVAGVGRKFVVWFPSRDYRTLVPV